MTLEKFIDELRNTDGYMEYIFTRGGCYRFHVLLSRMYKNCIPYINQEMNHVITRYKGKYYDINGEIGCLDGYRKLTENDKEIVEKWSFRKNNLLVLNECPNCDEPLIWDAH
jgi:uncharacterized protein YggL (DUF469 family)